MEIKVGDKVKLLKDMYEHKPYKNQYKMNSIHTVLSVRHDGCDLMVRVCPEEPTNGYSSHLFELVQKDKILMQPTKTDNKSGWGF